MRSKAKFFLNSLWGYIAMNQDRSSNKIIKNLSDRFKMLADSKNIIKNVNFNHQNSTRDIY